MSQELAVPGKEGQVSILRSESLRRAVNGKVQQIERSIVINKQKRQKDALGALEAVKKEVQVRIKENHAASRAAEACVRTVDDTFKETGLWVTKLHHERYKQFAALSVCERRLQLREGNPPELSKDSLQDALEIEQRVLNNARKEFLTMEAEVKQVLQDLTAVRCELSKDAARRRLAVETDRAILVNVALSATVAPGARSLPSASADGGNHAASANDTQEDGHGILTMKESQKLCQRSLQLEEWAAELRMRSKSCIIRVRDECNRSNFRVGQRLTKRTEDTLNVTKQLIGQGKEVDYTIITAQRSLAANQKFLDKRDRQQSASYQAAKSMLEELERSRRDLQSDLRRNTCLLSTSEACRKVTPQTASSPPPAALVRPRPSTAGGRTRGRTSSSMSNTSNSCRSPATLGRPASTPTLLPALPPVRSPEVSPEAMPEAMPEVTLPQAESPEVQSPTTFEGEAVNLKEAPAV